ncbi:uncharacterized protein Tco025E_08628 [Trypanosoma conorhini]|uniref:Uncharacterized protein n=1 Tax=Trypanosoma conorhini TaxID=83891 RepID=A0A422N759_9TRYP|nr:uncharacterized protein Tco025E_08628 [Trypanosoma conorhini]RNF01281.1 hypothetical protein Tco025E_08628 [Trypanosoma conorhini]
MHRCFDGVRASNGDPPSDNVLSAVGLRPQFFISDQPRKRHKGALVGMDALSSIESHITAVPDIVVCVSAFPPRSVGAQPTSVVVKRTLKKRKKNNRTSLAMPATSPWCQGPVPRPGGSQEPALYSVAVDWGGRQAVDNQREREQAASPALWGE